MRVSIVLGTRPQIIKSAPVYEALKQRGVQCEIVNTGQHYDYEMNRQFFSELKLPDPAEDLNVGAGSPAEQVSGIVGGLGRAYAKEKPDLAIVPGDTNSALAAGVACSKSGVPVAHLESGCRSYDIRMAEEVNRRVLDHLSHVLLCPTQTCVLNLRSEHVIAKVVSKVGDTMYDSLLRFKPKLDGAGAASRHGLEKGGYAFLTLHRAETVDSDTVLRAVLRAVGSLGVPVAFAVHPRTRARMKEFGIEPGRDVELLEPLPYLETLSLVEGSGFVVTDSGGLQKEAYWLGKPTLIARGTTEWVEIVRAGAAFLVGADPAKFRRGYQRLKWVGTKPFDQAERIFGHGNASTKAAGVVSRFLESRGPSGV